MRASQDKDCVAFEISDDGKGSSHLENLNETDLKEIELEIKLVKSKLKKLGWELKIISEKGKGTTFRIIIPLT